MFLYILFILSIFYIVLLNYVRKNFTNFEIISSFQKEMNELNKQFKEASMKKDVELMDKISKKQMEMIPKMKGLMFEQFKIMILSLVLFYLFYLSLPYLHHVEQKHLIIQNQSDKLYVSIPIDKSIASLSLHVNNIKKTMYVSTKYDIRNNLTENNIHIYLDKSKYNVGDNAMLIIEPNNVSVDVIYDYGEDTYIDLPFNLFGIRFIYGARSVFIFFAFIVGWIYSFIESKTRNKKK